MTNKLSPEAQSIHINGIYEHYKGPHYKVYHIARNSETLEELVIYQSLYGNYEMWARPVTMFLEKVTIKGHTKPRFKFIPEPNADNHSS